MFAAANAIKIGLRERIVPAQTSCRGVRKEGMPILVLDARAARFLGSW